MNAFMGTIIALDMSAAFTGTQSAVSVLLPSGANTPPVLCVRVFD